MNRSNAVLASGFVQLAWASWQGGLLLMNGKRAQPTKLTLDQRRLLQSHLDNILMALMQIELAGRGERSRADAILMCAGCWIAPQTFFAEALKPGILTNHRWLRHADVPALVGLGYSLTRQAVQVVGRTLSQQESLIVSRIS